MKRFTHILCLILAFAMVFSSTAYAAEIPDSRASHFFTYSSVYFWHVSGNQYQIWFDVDAVDLMKELGASEIRVQRSTDLENWTTVKTYTKANYPQMTTTASTVTYANYVNYYPADGYAYRALVELYAKNSSGTGYMTEVTATLDLR